MMVSYRKYTRTSFATVKGISTTDGRSVQSFLGTATAVIPDLRLSVRAGIQQQHFHLENNMNVIDSRRLKEYSFFALQRPPTENAKVSSGQMFKVTGLIHKLCLVRARACNIAYGLS